jgi:hypothetical protein
LGQIAHRSRDRIDKVLHCHADLLRASRKLLAADSAIVSRLCDRTHHIQCIYVVLYTYVRNAVCMHDDGGCRRDETESVRRSRRRLSEAAAAAVPIPLRNPLFSVTVD